MTQAEQLERHRTALTGHCYRMMGSVADADDAVQETMIRALRGLERFDERSTLRTWLYRIATNVCLDLLTQRQRRERPMWQGPVGTVDDELHRLPRTHWLEPVPDALAIPVDGDPSEALALRQSVKLAFVGALQHLPPRQRAALLLTDVLGWPAGEVAERLDWSTAAVNSALQRARATLQARDVRESPPELTAAQAQLVERYVDAFLKYDVDSLVSMLAHDATLSMPPYTLWLQGHDPIRTWLGGRGAGCRGSKLVRVAASGLPAFGQYRPRADGRGFDPWAVVVLELGDDRITSWNSFLDTETLFARFGLPAHLD